MAATKKVITLKSSDKECFDVEEAVILQSQTIKHMIEDGCADDGIPLPNVTSKILAKVIEYCKKHVSSTPKEEEEEDHDQDQDQPTKVLEEDLKKWDAEFVEEEDQATLFDLIVAANYLDIKNLLDLTCETVAAMIRDKTPEEIRNTFNIENDFTKDEEDLIRRENQWVYE